MSDHEISTAKPAGSPAFSPKPGSRFAGSRPGGARPTGGRPNDNDAAGRAKTGFRRPFLRRRKVCLFCADKTLRIDYKDPKLMLRFITERGKMVPSRITGICSPHQRHLGKAIKRARNIALLPFLVK